MSETHLIFSYVPLLRGEPGKRFSPDEIEGLAKKAMESPVGNAIGAMWSLESGKSSPTLIMDKATEIATHLNEWSEGSPGDWFTLFYEKNEHGYALVLMPNIQKSIERMRKTMPGSEEGLNYKVIFKPLVFQAEKSDALSAAENYFKEETEVFVLESEFVNPEKVNANLLNHRVGLGKFKIERGGIAKSYLDDMIEDEIPKAESEEAAAE
jgi:hypothetical protein